MYIERIYNIQIFEWSIFVTASSGYLFFKTLYIYIYVMMIVWVCVSVALAGWLVVRLVHGG